MSKFRLLVVCGDDADATSFYRGLGPLSALRKETESWLELVVNWGEFEFNENRLRLIDGIFIQRPTNSAHFELLTVAKSLGLPIWLDLDDDVFSIPEENPVKSLYETNNWTQHAANCLKLADVVTVTTSALKASVERFAKNVVVIPNALDDGYLHRPEEPAPQPKNPVVLWRGSASHDRDLLEIAGPLDEVAEFYDKWKWVFLGHKPWVVTKDLPKGSWHHIGWNSSALNYIRTLYRIQPSLVIVPLVDHAFNRSKSNIAWIEASFAGAAVIAPAWEEWSHPGILQYEGRDGFRAVLEAALAGKHDLKSHAERSWEYVSRHLVLSQVNHHRLELLEDFI